MLIDPFPGYLKNDMYTYEEEALQVIKLLKEGKIILYPTDTVWGIGCLVSHPDSIERIFQIKKRDRGKSTILLVDSIQMLKKYITSIHPKVETLMGFHNRPLTVIYPQSRNLDQSIPAEDGSIAIRVCEDPFCKMLIQGVQMPIISTSANIANQPSPGSFSEISSEILSAVDYVVRYRQLDKTPHEPSVIVTYDSDGELIFVRT
jgi:L-threonylcarbamoyladenylate synthase